MIIFLYIPGRRAAHTIQGNPKKSWKIETILKVLGSCLLEFEGFLSDYPSKDMIWFIIFCDLFISISEEADIAIKFCSHFETGKFVVSWNYLKEMESSKANKTVCNDAMKNRKLNNNFFHWLIRSREIQWAIIINCLSVLEVISPLHRNKKKSCLSCVF